MLYLKTAVPVSTKLFLGVKDWKYIFSEYRYTGTI